MNKINKLVAAFVAAFSAGSIALQADARMQLAANGFGDALIFPAFSGLVENYFTISNAGGNYVQGHIRFRGAARGRELLEFDVILGPYDVFVFRLADIDGDGQWEIDQSIDPLNFAHTSLIQRCYGAVSVDNCMDADNAPELAALSQTDADYNRSLGYVEFIGEAVLDGMTSAHMDALLGHMSLASVGLTSAHRTQTGTGFGTNTWRWSTAGYLNNVSPYPDDQGLSDFPNIAGGTAFITIPGQSTGLAYNAEALVNFRTALDGANQHRIDNYIRGLLQIADHPHPAVDSWFGASTPALDAAVILHHEDATVPDAQYVYRFNDTAGDAGGVYEHGISYRDSRGPTLADGDDYELGPEEAGGDQYDILYNVPNSIAEVEDAIRAGGQIFGSFYFDDDVFDKTGSSDNEGPSGSVAIKSWFFALFPTMHHYAAYLPCQDAPAFGEFIDCKAYGFADTGRIIYAAVCDINTNCGERKYYRSSVIDPLVPLALARELSLFDIDFLKTSEFMSNYRSGRAMLSFARADASEWKGPGLFYTFEITSDGRLGHWRAMRRK
ncbi:MAG: hypothetical protein GY862_14975 [Gammaproteobacteria bacterium]|nr:hypothetical protein [Gammaproteobacteria bacterium]